MSESTSIEVKCECKIPFHAELVAGLHKLLSGALTGKELPREVPNLAAICQAIHSKIIFIRVITAAPVKGLHKKLLKPVKRMLNKDLVGTIEKGQGDVTLVLA